MIINGYVPPLMNEHFRPGALYQLGVLYKNYKSYFMNATDSIKNRIESNAAELGRPVEYRSPAKGSVFRIETTINDSREFKVYAAVHHKNICSVFIIS